MATHRASQVAQSIKNLPAGAGDPGLIPGLEDPLEKGMVTHSSILAWRESGRSLGEGNGSPLQYFCLENAMDRGAWLQSKGLQRVGND